MAKQVTAKDVAEALSKAPANMKAGFADGTVKDVGSQPLAALKSEVFDMTGKKLKCTVSVIRNGKEFVLQQGTAWENIAEHFKTGLGRINFSAADFE